MQSRCRGLDRSSSILFKMTTKAALIACSYVVTLPGNSSPISFSSDIPARRESLSASITTFVDAEAKNRTLKPPHFLADNANYDGASLPPPPKKRVTINSEEGDSNTDAMPKPRRHRHDDESLGGKASDNESSAKPKPADMSNEHKGPGHPPRSGNDPRSGFGLFGRGPLDLTPLGLSEEQKQKIQQLRADNANKARELSRKRHYLGGQMKDVLFDPESTDAQIKAKRDELRQVQEKLEDIRLDDMLAIRSVLTAEQKQKLRDLKVAVGPPNGPASGPNNSPPSGQPSSPNGAGGQGDDGAPRRRARPQPKDDSHAKVSEASGNSKQ